MASALSGISSGGGNPAGSAQPARAGAGDPLANKDIFLKLMVAQLQHQNPLDPADPIEFLSQLAQFAQLEHMIAMRQELEGIHSKLSPAGGSAAPGRQEPAVPEADSGVGVAAANGGAKP